MRLAVAISGYSGSGKTTLIEELLPRLAKLSLRVGVLKHDTHQLTLDKEGKDTARFFAAGAAAVCAHDPTQHFVRIREQGPVPLTDMLPGLPLDLDLLLIEGHKDAPLPKIVLEHPEERPAIDGPEVIATLPFGDDRASQAEQQIVAWLAEAWRARPLGVALFFGGAPRSRSSKSEGPQRQTGPDDLAGLLSRLENWADRLILVGDGPPPEPLGKAFAVLPDVPGLEGPLAGLLGLLRFDPQRAWLCVAVDQLALSDEHIRWLVEQRRAGVWALLPELHDGLLEPFGAIYEPMLLPAFERAVARGERAIHRIVERSPLANPHIPEQLAAGWHDVSARRLRRAKK